jgi:phosphate transport system permease protein
VPAPLASILGRGLTIFAGVPSVVYGLVGLSVLVPWIAAWQPPGASLLAATLVLAAMILPTIAISADAALAAVPPEYHHGAAALGMSRSRTVVGVLLPAASRGVAAGVVLAFARALGETLAVVMVAGNVVQLPGGLFDPVRTLTANIALEMAYATGTHRSALFASGLALMVLVLGLAGLGRVRRQAG